MAATETPTSLSDRYSGPIRFASVQQAPIAIGCVLMLDGGQTSRICGIAMIGFWCGVGWLWLRRRTHPSRTDIAFIRWGFLPILVVSMLLGSAWVRWHQA